MFSRAKTPSLLATLQQRYEDARMDLIRAEEAADAAAITLAERNEAVLYGKERLSRLASHINAVKRDEMDKSTSTPGSLPLNDRDPKELE